MQTYQDVFSGKHDRFHLSPEMELETIKNTCAYVTRILFNKATFISGLYPSYRSSATTIDCQIPDYDDKSLLGINLPKSQSDKILANEKEVVTWKTSELRPTEAIYKALSSLSVEHIVSCRIKNPRTSECLLHFGFSSQDWTFNKAAKMRISETARSISDILELAYHSKLQKESDEKYRVLFQNIPFALLTLEPDGTLSDFNRAAMNLFEIAVSEKGKRQLLDFFQEGEAGRALSFLTATTDFQLQAQTCRMQSFSGRVFNAEVQTFPFSQSQILLLIQDVSIRKELEEHMVNTRKMESIALLSSGIANDFNHEIGKIIEHTDFLRYSLPLEPAEEANWTLERIDAAAQRCLKFTDRISALTHHETKQKDQIDLNAFVHEELAKFKETVGEKLSCNEKLAAKAYPISANAQQLQVLLRHIFGNAIDAIGEKGKLVVSTKTHTIDGPLLTAYPYLKAGTFYELQITDNGSGIPDQIRQRIFEPFFTTKSGGGRKGLGLSIAYSIVRNHGGLIQLDSVESIGTTIRISFPEDTTTSKLPLAEMLKTKVDAKTILIVDDEEMIRQLAQAFLQRMGYKTLSAINGKEAVEVYSKHEEEIDMIIMDIVMPEMDGKEAGMRIKRINPNAKILYSSGYTQDAEFLDSLQQESVPFLRKPYLLEDFFESVTDLLDTHS
jgi:PAS domain S-box-containing protein